MRWRTPLTLSPSPHRHVSSTSPPSTLRRASPLHHPPLLSTTDPVAHAAKAPGWTPLEASKFLSTYAVDNFTLPGEPGFPLNTVYAAPGGRAEAGECFWIWGVCFRSWLQEREWEWEWEWEGCGAVRWE